MAEVHLNAEAARVASRIRAIDHALDQLQTERDESVIRGMRAALAASVVNRWGQDRADARRGALLAERSELVTRLRTLVGDG